MVDYQQLIDVGLSPDRQTLTERVVTLAEALGFGLTSGVLIRGRFGSPNALVESFGNPPAAYGEASRSLEDGLRDPVMTRLLAGPGHMTYGQDLYVTAGAIDLWDCQAAFGYKHGMSMSIHSPAHAEAFLFGVDRPDVLPTDAAEFFRLQATLQMIALHAQEAMNRILETTPQRQGCDLTAQEVHALQRVAATVYAKRGNLVGISQVMSADLQIAMRKLKAQSLPGAILRAVDGGFIDR